MAQMNCSQLFLWSFVCIFCTLSSSGRKGKMVTLSTNTW